MSQSPLLVFIRDAIDFIQEGSLVAPSREASLARTKLEEARFWAEQALKKES